MFISNTLIHWPFVLLKISRMVFPEISDLWLREPKQMASAFCASSRQALSRYM